MSNTTHPDNKTHLLNWVTFRLRISTHELGTVLQNKPKSV